MFLFYWKIDYILSPPPKENNNTTNINLKTEPATFKF